MLLTKRAAKKEEKDSSDMDGFKAYRQLSLSHKLDTAEKKKAMSSIRQFGDDSAEQKKDELKNGFLVVVFWPLLTGLRPYGY